MQDVEEPMGEGSHMQRQKPSFRLRYVPPPQIPPSVRLLGAERKSVIS